MKLIHVDEYGRPGELYADEVIIDGQYYLKAYCGSYSIFYAEEDVSPVFDDDSKDGINWAIVVIGVAIIAIAAFMILRSKKKSNC